jgi:hypothetical protein
MKEGAFLQSLIFFRQEGSGRRRMSIQQAIPPPHPPKKKKKKKEKSSHCGADLLHGHASLPYIDMFSNDVSTVVTIPLASLKLTYD